ncbi:MAG: response regulator transcription factor [Betaproteobacteria bacterium]
MKNVFLVEDSHLVLERLESLINAVPGARVAGSAACAERAIRNILDAKPDIVLCDLKLATGSGFDVLRAVHELAPQIDVYMLSNFASEPYRRLAAELGARDFFDKSSEIERVRDVVAQRAAVA